MEILRINCGNFSSLDNFYQNVGMSMTFEKPDQGGEQKIYGRIELDCRLLNRVKNIRLAVLTSLLALSYRLKHTYGIVSHIMLYDDLSIFEFLKNTNLYLVSKRDEIINWDEYEEDEDVGMLVLMHNINCKIISFSDLVTVDNDPSASGVIKSKNYLMDVLSQRILSEFAPIVSTAYADDRKLIVRLLSNTITEFVINALVHGKSGAYLGIQVSRGGISVCVSDSGIGILSSLKTNYNSKWVLNVGLSEDIDAIVNVSLKHNVAIGMRDAIGDVAEASGYTVVSSGNALVVWGKENWERALGSFDHTRYRNELQGYKSILSSPLEKYYTSEELIEKGGYKVFQYSLPGTRIYFEIPF